MQVDAINQKMLWTCWLLAQVATTYWSIGLLTIWKKFQKFPGKMEKEQLSPEYALALESQQHQGQM